MADIVSAGIVSGQLYISLSDGTIIPCGMVQGPQGLTGSQGPQGATGRPGTDGNTILHSAGRPRPDLGKDGDWHINTVDYIISLKENGTWGKGQPLLVDGSKMGTLDQGGKRIKGGPGRFFPLGGASSSVAALPPTGEGLEPIIGNGGPLGANTWSPLAIDDEGDLIEATLYFSRAGGNEVYVAKVIAFRANTAGNLTIAWEAAQPTSMTYVVTFDAVVIGAQLTVRVQSDTSWESIRGRVSKL
jgi:hypothetical protein